MTTPTTAEATTEAPTIPGIAPDEPPKRRSGPRIPGFGPTPPAAPKRERAPRSAATTPKATEAEVVQIMSGLYGAAGFALAMAGRPEAAEVVYANTPAIAAEWGKVAKANPGVAAAIAKLLGAGVWTGLAMAHVGLAQQLGPTLRQTKRPTPPASDIDAEWAAAMVDADPVNGAAVADSLTEPFSVG